MRFSEDKLESLTCSDGIKRNIHIWEPETPKALFLAIHGAMAHGGDYVTPALFFKKHDIVTLAPDLHGHDLKAKVFIPHFDIFLDDLEILISWTKENYPGIPVFIMGHSMGSLIATHFGLKRLNPDHQIKGFILSSPYYVNLVKTPPLLLKLVGLLSALLPKMHVPIEDITSYLTQDKSISDRHKQDELYHIRASKVSARFANELLKAQQNIPDHIQDWSQPMICVVAGNDRLANSKITLQYLNKIEKDLLTLHHYPDNFHENFNELNREEVFSNILRWLNEMI